jgi:hypothetical protein
LLKTGSFSSIVATGLVAVAVACSSGGDSSSDSQSNSGENTPAATATQSASSGGGGSTDLSAVARAYANLKSYKIDMVIEAPGQGRTQARAELVAPDRMHLTMSLASQGEVEIILIGTDSYVKVGNSWTRQSIPGLDAASVFDADEIASDIENLQKDATRGSTATVNGKACQIYTSTIAGGSFETCIADNLPQRMFYESAGSKVTIVFSDFNANITISPPV